jgi:hypothetical protein
MRGIVQDSLAALGSASQAGHIRLGPGFIEEHQPGRVQFDLRLLPVFARLFYVGSVLLTRS